MKFFLIVLISLISVFSSISYADTQAETGSVAATVSKNLTDEMSHVLFSWISKSMNTV